MTLSAPCWSPDLNIPVLQVTPVVVQVWAGCATHHTLLHTSTAVAHMPQSESTPADTLTSAPASGCVMRVCRGQRSALHVSVQQYESVKAVFVSVEQYERPEVSSVYECRDKKVFIFAKTYPDL